MIHRDSPESPVYRANLTEREKMREHMKISSARLKSLAKSNNTTSSSSVHTDDFTIRPKIGLTFLFYVEIGFGTFVGEGPTTYSLALDTGSDLTWIQCEGCTNCFQQPAPYPASQSSTYQRISTQDDYCLGIGGKIQGDDCLFIREYGDGSNVTALAAYETLDIRDPSDQWVHLAPFTFGCGIDMQNFQEGNDPNNIVNGMLGMSNEELSFVHQGMEVSLGNFSYCLQTPEAARAGTVPMYLRFGNDVTQVQLPPLQSTRFGSYTFNPGYYYLTLLGITVDSIRLPLDPAVFEVKPDETGGCMIDSGTETTFIITDAYKVLLEAVSNYIETRNPNARRLDPQRSDHLGYELCYQPVDIDLPTIIFHFGNDADFVITGDANFIRAPEPETRDMVICFNIFESTLEYDDDITILGSYQQANQRIIYDTQNSVLSFGPQDCLQYN